MDSEEQVYRVNKPDTILHIWMQTVILMRLCSWLCPSSCQDSKNNTKFHTCPQDNAEHTNGLSSSSSILVLWVSVVHSWSCLSKNKLSSYNWFIYCHLKYLKTYVGQIRNKNNSDNQIWSNYIQIWQFCQCLHYIFVKNRAVSSIKR